MGFLASYDTDFKACLQLKNCLNFYQIPVRAHTYTPSYVKLSMFLMSALVLPYPVTRSNELPRSGLVPFCCENIYRTIYLETFNIPIFFHLRVFTIPYSTYLKLLNGFYFYQFVPVFLVKLSKDRIAMTS